MMVSCPKKSNHTEVLADRITSIINDEMGDDSVMLALSSLFGGSISKYVVNNCVDVKDYVLCSVGKYPVITLCGSTRFQEQIRQNAELAAFLEEANRRRE